VGENKSEKGIPLFVLMTVRPSHDLNLLTASIEFPLRDRLG